MPLKAGAINEILPFAADANEAVGDVMSLTEYATSPLRARGHQPGIASRSLQNRATRQSALISAGLAQAVANSGNAVKDDGDVDAIEAGVLGLINSEIIEAAGSTSPAMNGTAKTGTAVKYAREDHVHPTDTSRAPLVSPTFTGTPAAPTAPAGTNNTQLATTAFVKGAVDTAVNPLAPKASPTFTGTPKAPTAAAGTNTTQIATTAFVKGETTPILEAINNFGSVYVTQSDLNSAASAKLTKSSNLSDVPDKAVALKNLGVETVTSTQFGDIDFVAGGQLVPLNVARNHGFLGTSKALGSNQNYDALVTPGTYNVNAAGAVNNPYPESAVITISRRSPNSTEELIWQHVTTVNGHQAVRCRLGTRPTSSDPWVYNWTAWNFYGKGLGTVEQAMQGTSAHVAVTPPGLRAFIDNLFQTHGTQITNVTSQRAVGVEYVNSNSRTMWIHLFADFSVATSIVIAGKTLAIPSDGDWSSQINVPVPAGATYKLNGTNAIYSWSEQV